MAVTCSWLLVYIAVAAANSSLHHLTCHILHLDVALFVTFRVRAMHG